VGTEEEIPGGFDTETNLIVSGNMIIMDGEIEIWPNPVRYIFIISSKGFINEYVINLIILF